MLIITTLTLLIAISSGCGQMGPLQLSENKKNITTNKLNF